MQVCHMMCIFFLLSIISASFVLFFCWWYISSILMKFNNHEKKLNSFYSCFSFIVFYQEVVFTCLCSCDPTLQFPEFIASFFSRISLPSMGSPRAASTRNVAGNVPSYPGRQVEASFTLCLLLLWVDLHN